MTPLLAPVVTFQSHVSSKFSYSLSDTMSPPCASLAAPRQVIAPSSMSQFLTSPVLLKPCQPFRLLPSKRLIQVCEAGSFFSFMADSFAADWAVLELLQAVMPPAIIDPT